MTTYGMLAWNQMLLGASGGAQTKTGLALGSAYTYATAGAALGVRFNAPVSGNLTDVWFFVSATAGTPGVVTCELRNYNGASAAKPGTSLLASQTITPGTTANKWINVHFATPYSVTVSTPYWLVFGDAGWTTGNTTTINDISGFTRNANLLNHMNAYTTADGFTTAGTLVSNNSPAMVLKFADGTLLGLPYTTATTYTSNTLERGFRIAGVTENLYICGALWGITTSNINGLKIYRGSTVPGGTTVFTLSFATGVGAVGAVYFPPFKLLKNTVYRIVLTFGGATTAPNYYQIEDYATTVDVTNCGVGGGTMYATIDNGAGGWTDSIDLFPEMGVIISDQSVQPGSLINGGVLSEA